MPYEHVPVFCMPGRRRRNAGALSAKAMGMKLVGADFRSEISYSFDVKEWNRKQYEKLEKQIEDKRDLHE